MESETEKNLTKGRDLRWIGVHVSGKCDYVKGEKAAYPNWLNHSHPARKDKDTCGVVLEIDFASWWTFTAYRFNLPLYSSSKGDCSPFDPVPEVAREAPPKISWQISSLTLIVEASRMLQGPNPLSPVGGFEIG